MFCSTFIEPWYMRIMGVQVGRGFYNSSAINPLSVDPDMCHLGDDVIWDRAFPQFHSFEQRVLKLSKVHVGDRATVGPGSVIMAGADIGEGSIVRARSVVMKDESVPAHSIAEGIPV